MDNVQTIIELYKTLSVFDKGRLAMGMEMVDSDSAAELAKRRPGRPTGSKAKPNGEPQEATAQEG